jgi:hypothetical protein
MGVRMYVKRLVVVMEEEEVDDQYLMLGRSPRTHTISRVVVATHVDVERDGDVTESIVHADWWWWWWLRVAVGAVQVRGGGRDSCRICVSSCKEYILGQVMVITIHMGQDNTRTIQGHRRKAAAGRVAGNCKARTKVLNTAKK